VTSQPQLWIRGVNGLPEIRPGDDLAALVAAHAEPPLLAGDVVVVTSKVVSKAAGLATVGDRRSLLAAHTDRVVARRGGTSIARTKQGLTLAAAGLDASNTPPGSVLPLPPDPDGEAVALRRRLQQLTGMILAVVITDTAGRPWRLGQTDIAVGAAGLPPLIDLAGQRDRYGNTLLVTAPAVVDAVAAAADLVQGKLADVPVAVLTGLSQLVLPPDEQGPGARALLRPEQDDLFGWGAADAVRIAVRRDDPDRHRGFPRPEIPVEDLVADALAVADPTTVGLVPAGSGWELVAMREVDETVLWEAGALVERLRVLAVSTRRQLVVERSRGPTTLARIVVEDLPGGTEPSP